jgi:hypothetical protein
VSIEKVDCLSPEAVRLGIDHGLSDVPSFVIGGKGVSGDAFHDSEVEGLIAREAKHARK